LRYPKEVVLKNCKEAVIRSLQADDEPKLSAFYAAIPDEDLWYMCYDARDPEVIRSWIKYSDKIFSTIAVSEDAIVAHARLHMREFGCFQHMGRLRIMVKPDHRRLRLGTWMLLDLIQCAMEKGLRELRADFVVDVEGAAIETAYKLDFFKKAILEDFVMDPQGKCHDLLIMTKRLHKDWGDF
jgi:GNAT superfamily N-acetyltransferase